MANISNHYPNEILEDKHQYRSIKILVKENTVFNGSSPIELKDQIEKTYSDVKDIFKRKSSDPQPASSMSDIRSASDRTKKLTKAKTIYGLALPLPNELSDSQSHQWESSTGFIGDKLGSLANTSIGFKGIKGNVNAALGELASSTGTRKPLIDPGYFQDYKGSNPREFTFSWELVPNNQEEAENIILILYNLKKYTLPTSTINGISLLSPYLFDLEIGNPIINNVINMNNVVCKNMTINYSAEGSLQFFADGIPKYMKLEMSFAERSTVTSNFY